MTLKKSLGLIVSVIVGLQLYGCGSMKVGGVATEATYAYEDGWVSQTYQTSLNGTYEACLETARQMGMTVTSKSLDAMGAEIKAVKGEQFFGFKLMEKPMNMTTLGVQAGDKGSRDAAKAVHESVAKSLTS
jgi:hypothetical protein